MRLLLRGWAALFEALGRFRRNRKQRRAAAAKRRNLKRRHSLDALEPRVVLNADPVAADDDYTTAVDQSIQFDPTVNDTDPDNDSLEVVGLYGRPHHGNLTWNADGTFTYAPNQGFVGTEALDYVVSDGQGHEARATFSITVNPPNQAPWVTDESSESLGSTDYYDGTPRQWVVGELLDAYADGDETPEIGDDDGDTVGIALVGVDDAGVGSWEYSLDGAEWQAVDGGLSDVNALILGRDAQLRFTPVADGAATGTASLSLRAWDGTDGAQSGDVVSLAANGGDSAYSVELGGFTFAVTEPVNHDFTLGSETGGDMIDVDGSWTFAPMANVADDPDGDVDFEVVEGEDFFGTIADNGDGTFTYTPDGQTGTVTFTVHYYDADYSHDQAISITVTPVNTPPTITFPTEEEHFFSVREGADPGTVILTGVAYDPDENESQTTYWSLEGIDATAFVVNVDTGAVELASGTAPGRYTFSIVATDSSGGADSQDVTVDVVPAAPSGLVVAADPMGNPQADLKLTWTDESAGEDGYEIFAADEDLDEAYESIGTTMADETTFTETMLAAGTHRYYRVVAFKDVPDERIYSSAAAGESRTAPGISAPGIDETVDWSGAFQAQGAADASSLQWSIDDVEHFSIDPTSGRVTAVDLLDPDADYLVTIYLDDAYGHDERTATFHTATVPAPAAFAADPDSADPSRAIALSWTYPSTYDDFEFEVSDDGGDWTTLAPITGNETSYVDSGLSPAQTRHYRLRGITDGVASAWSEATATTAVNAAPVAHDVEIDGDAGTDITGSYDVSDEDGDSLTFTILQDPLNGFVVDNGDGTFTYTPAADFTGDDSFTYVANDGTDDSNEATVRVTVRVNTPPVANEVEAYFEDDVAVVGAYDANDADDDPLSFRITNDPADGTVVDNGDGTFTYTPNAGFTGDDSFTYVANDGTDDSNEATIFVHGVPTAPTGPTAQTGRQTETSIDLDWTPVAAGASYEIFYGLNGDTPDPDETTIPNGPAIGVGANTATVEGLDPDTDYIFWIRAVRDGRYSGWVYSDTERTSGDVHNTPPTANDVEIDGKAGTEITGNYDAADDDGDSLTFTITLGPTDGTVVDNSDGTFTYTPNGGFYGNDSFTYVANDGTDDSNEATVYVTVRVNTPPVANAVDVDGDAGTDITGSYDAADADGDPLSFRITNDPAGGTVVDNGDGTFTYTPNTGFTGDDSFTYVANDGTDDSNEATVYVTVLVPNTPPVAHDVNVNGKAGTEITGTRTMVSDTKEQSTYL